jgi:hypothetical protein
LILHPDFECIVSTRLCEAENQRWISQNKVIKEIVITFCRVDPPMCFSDSDDVAQGHILRFGGFRQPNPWLTSIHIEKISPTQSESEWSHFFEEYSGQSNSGLALLPQLFPGLKNGQAISSFWMHFSNSYVVGHLGTIYY